MKAFDGFEYLYRWIMNTNDMLLQSSMLMCTPQEVAYVTGLINTVSAGVGDDYPFYSSVLPQIGGNLFRESTNGAYCLNSAAFGGLFIILQHLHDEPTNSSFWMMIHPRIASVAKELYADGHYASAVNRSLVEVEARLRELFRELRPGDSVPPKVGDLIGALLTDKGAYQFCDTTEQNRVARIVARASSAYPRGFLCISVSVITQEYRSVKRGCFRPDCHGKSTHESADFWVTSFRWSHMLKSHILSTVNKNECGGPSFALSVCRLP